MKIEKSKPRRGVVELVSEYKRNGVPFTAVSSELIGLGGQ